MRQLFCQSICSLHWKRCTGECQSRWNKGRYTALYAVLLLLGIHNVPLQVDSTADGSLFKRNELGVASEPFTHRCIHLLFDFAGQQSVLHLWPKSNAVFLLANLRALCVRQSLHKIVNGHKRCRPRRCVSWQHFK